MPCTVREGPKTSARGPLAAVWLVWALTDVAGTLQGQQADASRLQTAEALLHKREYKQAVAAFDAYLNLQGSDARGYAGKGEALARMRRFGQAERDLKLAHSLNSNDPRILHDLAAVLQNQGKYDEAIMFWRQLEAMEGADDRISNSPQIPYMRGRAALRLQLIPEAVTCFEKALLRKPDDPEIRQQLAGALMNEGAHAKAAKELEILLAQRPSDAKNRYYLGVCYTQLGRLEDGERELLESRRLDPKDSRVSERLGKLYTRAKKFDHAESIFREAVEKNTLSEQSWYNLSQLATRRGDDAEAAEFHKKYEEAKAKREQGEVEIRTFSRRVTANPKDTDAYFRHAELLLANADFGEAEEVLLRLLAAEPTHELGLINMSALLGRRGDYQGAFYELEKALEHNPSNVLANRDAARLLVALGRLAEAPPYFERALKGLEISDPRYGETLEGLLYARNALNQQAQAVPWIDRALAGTPRGDAAWIKLIERRVQFSNAGGNLKGALLVLEENFTTMTPDEEHFPRVVKLLHGLSQHLKDAPRTLKYQEVLERLERKD